MRARAVLLALLLLASIPFVPNSFVSPISASQTTHFGNDGFPTLVNINFNSSGYDVSTNLTLGESGVVAYGAMDVRGYSGQYSSSPATIGIDVGDDGDIEVGEELTVKYTFYKIGE